MNSLCYRIVFNVSRGLLMAVAEIAFGRGRQTRQRRRSGGVRPYAYLPLGAVSLAVQMLCGMGSVAQAQIIADPAAPANQRPTVLTDGASRPLVNIQTPRAGGVSRNTYSQFDVQNNGIVLNNNRTSNPWLAAGEAKVILNEVNSANPSYLNGAITVNGARAEVVVANPAGIKVDGASFINASRATLTTGTATLGAGGLERFDVRQGGIEIGSKGLNTKGVPYTEILSRAVVVSGKVEAETLSVIAGTQEVNRTSGDVTSLTPTAGSTKPAIAIDTVALGGMYAGHITLLSTEAGVGVRNAGTVQGVGTSGQLVITAEGRLVNSGLIDAHVTSVGTASGNIDNYGKLYGRDVLLVSAGGDFNHSGLGMVQPTGHASQVQVHAQRDINLASNSSIGSDGETSIDSVLFKGSVSLTAGRNLRSSGKVLSADSITMQSGGDLILLNPEVVSLSGPITLVGASRVELAGGALSGSWIQLESGAPFQSTASEIVLRSVNLAGAEGIVVRATGDVKLQEMAVKQLSSANGGIQLLAGRYVEIKNDKPGTHQHINAKGDVVLSGTAGITATGARISAGGNLRVETAKAHVKINTMANKESADQILTELNAGGDLGIYAYEGDVLADALKGLYAVLCGNARRHFGEAGMNG